MLLLVTDESAENEQRATEALLRSAVDGAVVVPVQAEWDHWRRVRDAGIPLVFVNRDVPELDCDMVGVDNERGAYEATSHLIAGGARRLLVLEEDLPITTTADRVAGFRRAMADAGLTVSDDPIRAVPTRRYDSLALPWQPEEAYRFAQTSAERRTIRTAIVAGNDYFALGLLRVLAERGLDVPGDVAVTGYGDHPYAAYLQTPLTTVRLPAAEVGTTAVDLLLQRLRSTGRAPAQDADPPGARRPRVDAPDRQAITSATAEAELSLSGAGAPANCDGVAVRYSSSQALTDSLCSPSRGGGRLVSRAPAYGWSSKRSGGPGSWILPRVGCSTSISRPWDSVCSHS